MRKFDTDFKYLIPPLSKEEYDLLRESILKEGCRDSIVVWTNRNDEFGKTIILDGHNRYEICTKNKILFETKVIGPKELKDMKEARIWVIQNQLGRRNLTDCQRGKLTLQLKEMIQTKAKAKEVEGGKKKGLMNSSKAKPISTRKELARIAGVSEDTIRKVEIIEKEAPPEVKEAADKGQISINKAYKKTRVSKSSEKSLMPDDYFVEELSSYIRSTKSRLERIIPHLDDLKPDVYNELMKLLTDLIKMIFDVTRKFYIEQMAREAEEAKKEDEEISPLLEKDEKDLTEEEKAKVEAWEEGFSKYHLYKEKFERCRGAWQELSKSQKKEFTKRYCEKEVNRID